MDKILRCNLGGMVASWAEYDDDSKWPPVKVSLTIIITGSRVNGFRHSSAIARTFTPGKSHIDWLHKGYSFPKFTKAAKFGSLLGFLFTNW